MPDSFKEVYKQHRTTQDKYTYFLLAAAAAAIGFSLQQTAQSSLEWSMIPLGLAVLCWGMSFVCGCRHVRCIALTINYNMSLLTVEQGMHPSVPNDPKCIQTVAQTINDAIDSNSKKAHRASTAQFHFLIGGALLFLVWHVTAMFLRTVH